MKPPGKVQSREHWRWGLQFIAWVCIIAALLTLLASVESLQFPKIGDAADSSLKFLAAAVACLVIVGAGRLLKFSGAGVTVEFGDEVNNSAMAIKKLEAEIAAIRESIGPIPTRVETLQEPLQEAVDIDALLKERPITVPDDPNKGRFGSRAQADGYSLSATFSCRNRSDPVVKVMIVAQTDKLDPHDRKFEIFLHEPSFGPRWRVPLVPKNGIARLDLYINGGFTVGAWVVGTRTLLELDLAQIPDAPDVVRTR